MCVCVFVSVSKCVFVCVVSVWEKSLHVVLVLVCVCVVSVWEKSLHVVLGKKKIEQEKVTPTNKKG